MPLSPAQPDALARTYAGSLLDLAESKGGQATIESTLGELEDILELARNDDRFAEFLSSLALTGAKREASLRRILEGRVSDLVVRFLLVLNMRDRLGHLPAIVAALDQMVQDRFGRIEVDVFTAAPLSGENLASIRSRLASALNKEVILHPYTDAAMLGGVKFRLGDRLVDGSVATRLRKMREQLASGGAAEIRARAERIIQDTRLE